MWRYGTHHRRRHRSWPQGYRSAVTSSSPSSSVKTTCALVKLMLSFLPAKQQTVFLLSHCLTKNVSEGQNMCFLHSHYF
jgi:hypothetical protein